MLVPGSSETHGLPVGEKQDTSDSLEGTPAVLPTWPVIPMFEGVEM